MSGSAALRLVVTVLVLVWLQCALLALETVGYVWLELEAVSGEVQVLLYLMVCQCLGWFSLSLYGAVWKATLRYNADAALEAEVEEEMKED